ncbi:MAG: hypothetical protein J6X89_00030 [Bacteroidales bacterium]|nr:hypothetical protein [Bacteroidales bacterium]
MLTPDFEQTWERIAPGFMPDAVREFNGYPEVVLAWAAYLGAAVACLWDRDWVKYKDCDYAFYCGERGFDYLDEHITEHILELKLDSPQAENLANFFRSKATEAHSMLLHSGVEPGTVEAYNSFTNALEAMYTLGASHILSQLGYKWQQA